MSKNSPNSLSNQNIFQITIQIDELAARLVSQMREQGLTATTQPVFQRLLSVKEAAKYLGRSEAAVRNLIAAGKLKPVKKDRRIFLDRKDLDEGIDADKIEVAD